MLGVLPGTVTNRYWPRTALSLLETVPDAVVAVDSAGTIVYANNLIEHVFGFDRSEIVGRSVEILVPEHARSRHRQHRRAYEQTRATRPMASGADLKGLHESGREFPVDISLSPIESDEGPLVIAAIRDMTERRSVERELRRVNEQLRRDVNAAARIQRSLLPDRSAGIPGVAVEWLFEPSDRLGGDSFNVFDAADRVVGFYMLDVTGHGIVTALQSVALTRILASTWPQPTSPMPGRLGGGLNAEFPINVEAWEYFTFLGGVLDLSKRTVRYVSAGHHGPVHVPAGGAPVALEAAGLPIGMFPDAEYEEFAKRLEPGDRLYLFSDGVTEAMNEAEEDFGVDRLVAALAEAGPRPLSETLRQVRRAVDRWCGGELLQDDFTLLGLEVQAQ
ncbi:MAG: SpoIIE family protein phosphatase [Acidobacteria bacterium]|nr:SpoIIE family protein phosphatase [Acidobacteriota bacterium]